VAALERDLVAWDYEATRIEVLTQVTQAFVEVLSAQQRLRLNLELVRLAEQVLRTATERVRAGKVSPVEETRAQVALSTSRLRYVQGDDASCGIGKHSSRTRRDLPRAVFYPQDAPAKLALGRVGKP